MLIGFHVQRKIDVRYYETRLVRVLPRLLRQLVFTVLLDASQTRRCQCRCGRCVCSVQLLTCLLVLLLCVECMTTHQCSDDNANVRTNYPKSSTSNLRERLPQQRPPQCWYSSKGSKSQTRTNVHCRRPMGKVSLP